MAGAILKRAAPAAWLQSSINICQKHVRARRTYYLRISVLRGEIVVERHADEAVESVVRPLKRHGGYSVIVVTFGNIVAPRRVITHQAPVKFRPALEAAEERQSQQPGNVAAILRIAERLARMSR
jgi:hypothetical protein